MSALLKLEKKDLSAVEGTATALASLIQDRDVIFLKGDLGTGKTTFARYFIQSLLREEEAIPSPTFTFVQPYKTPKGLVTHLDLYRLEHPEELVEIGLEEILEEGVVLIEWPEKLGYFTTMIEDPLTLELEIESQQGFRSLVFKGSEAWGKRLSALKAIE